MQDKPQLPPTPKGSKIRHALSLGVDIWNNLDRFQELHGDTFTLTLPNQGPMVWTGNPQVVRDLFALKPEQYNPVEVQFPVDVGEQCVLFENFKPHQESRKRIIPTLATNKLKERAQVMQDITNEHISSWQPGTRLNIPRMVGDITLDITCYTLFNLRSGERRDKYKELMLGWINSSTNDLMFTISQMFGALKFRNSLNAKYLKRSAQGKMGNLRKGIVPWKQSLDYKVHLTHMIREDIADIRSRMDEDESHLLSVFARATYEDGQLLEIEKVLSETVALMLAGHETSAATSAWLMVWMLKRPEMYQQVRNEVDQFFASEEEPDAVKLSELPLVGACLNESQRLSPSAPATARWLTQDTKLGDWFIPAGTCMAPCMYLTQRRKDIFGEDAHEFRPERWLDGSCKPKPWEFFPFGGGRRACAGMAQARQQMRILLAELAHRVNLESDVDYAHMDGMPTPRLVGGQTEPKDGVWVTVKEVRPQHAEVPHLRKSA